MYQWEEYCLTKRENLRLACPQVVTVCPHEDCHGRRIV